MNNTSCPVTLSLQPSIEVLRFGTYYIIAPIYGPLGLLCHSLFLLALYRQSKMQPAYLYQVFQAVAETVEVLVRVLNIVYRITTGGAAYGESYQNPFKPLTFVYEFMWYGGRMSAYLMNSIITTSLLLSVSMAADRVFALYKPNKYRWIKHQRHQFMALFLSIILSFSASAFDCFRNTIVENRSGGYDVVLNRQFIGSLRALIFAVCITALQLIGLATLIILSCALCYLYRSQYVKPKQTGVTSVDAQKQLETKRGERILAQLTLIECVFKALGTSFPVFMYLAQYASPASFACISPLMTCLLDLTMTLVDLGGFFALVTVSKGIRRILGAAIPCVKNGNLVFTSAVVPYNSANAA